MVDQSQEVRKISCVITMIRKGTSRKIVCNTRRVQRRLLKQQIVKNVLQVPLTMEKFYVVKHKLILKAKGSSLMFG